MKTLSANRPTCSRAARTIRARSKGVSRSKTVAMARAYSCKHTPFKWSFARAHERRWLPGGRGAHLRCRREKPSLDALARPHDVRRRASRVVRDGDNSRRHHFDDAYPKVLVPHGVQADRRAAEPSLQIAPLGVDDKVDVVPDLQLRRQRLASGERSQKSASDAGARRALTRSASTRASSSGLRLPPAMTSRQSRNWSPISRSSWKARSCARDPRKARRVSVGTQEVCTASLSNPPGARGLSLVGTGRWRARHAPADPRAIP